ncbi:MAG: MerR family transcriptional regulator [Cytophagales bacterium]|nr:MAG: MerR family transcriptional regulator [Cytophagales bacterium]
MSETSDSNSLSKKYYSIGEVAEMFNVATSLIRFWQSEFEIINPQKSKTGLRQFTPEDIENIRLVYHLVKEKGFTLQGAKDALKQSKKKVKTQMEMLESLKKIRSFLVDMRNTLPTDPSL